jgi:class 3 adenylate cyclase
MPVTPSTRAAIVREVNPIEEAARARAAERFLARRAPLVDTSARMTRGSPTTELVTALFTDIVRSTAIAGEVGDGRWRELVAAHHALVRDRLKRHRGREMDTAGDGFFATFSRPAEAIRCAIEISDGVRAFGLEIRAGLHLGEAEVMGSKVGGVAVNTAARIMALGKAGEVLVSGTVRDAVAGKGIDFVDHGMHQLKGLDGEYRVWDAVAADGVARGLPLEPEEARRRRELGPPSTCRRRPWWLAAAGVGVLAAAGIGLAIARDRGPESTPTAAIEGRTLTEADAQVIELVPAALAESCAATDPLPRDAVGSVTCSDGDYEVRYDTYADADALDTAFASSTAGQDLAGISCRDDRAASGVYTVDGASKGRVACFVDQPTSLAFVPTVVWTDDELLVMARGTREFLLVYAGSTPDLSVYEWWRIAAGPGSGGSFRPKDEPADVPSGSFTSTVTEEQVGPASEGGADARWVGTWTIAFDGEVFVERFDDRFEEDSSYQIESVLLWGKGQRLVLQRDYQFPPLGGVTEPCERYESLHWELDGDMLVFSEPSPEQPCQAFRDLAVFQPSERVE